MLHAGQGQLHPDSLGLHDGDNTAPQVAMDCSKICIPENIESASGTRQRNADTVLDGQESDVVTTATDHGENDDLVFFTLIGVDGNDLQVQALKVRVSFHKAQQMLSLSIVEGQNGDLVDRHTVLD